MVQPQGSQRRILIVCAAAGVSASDYCCLELGTKGGFAAGHAQSSGYRCEEGFGSNTLFVLAPL